MTGTRLLSASEVARRLDVHKATVTRWIALGLVPAERRGAEWRVRSVWVNEVLERRGRQSTP